MSRETRRPLTLDLSAAHAATSAEEATPQAASAPPPPRGRPTPPPKPPRAAPVPVAAKPGRARTPKPKAEAGPFLAANAYPLAFAAAALWAGTLAAFVFGYEGRGGAFNYAPFRWAVAAALALLPAAFMLLFAYALRQGARLAHEAARARALAQDLVLPVGLAAHQTAGVVDAVRAEIARAAQEAVEAGRRLAELREALAHETKAVGEAALQAERSARTLSGRLQAERADLGALATELGAQTEAVTEGMSRHAQMLADAARTAHDHAEEADGLLRARAEELLAAAGEAGRAAQDVGGELAHQTSRLHHLASDLREEREDFARTADGLMSDEEALGARLESRRARLAEVAAEARTGVDTLNQQAAAGAERLNALIQEAAGALKVMGEEAQAHEAELDARARERVSAFSGLVAEERATLEGQSRAALDRVTQAAQAAQAAAEEAGDRMAARVEAAAESAEQSVRRQMDELGEAAFTTGQNVDQAFDVRIAAARRTLEASAALVEETGARSAGRVEAALAGVRDAAGGLQGLLAELDLKLSHAPQEAAARAAEVSAAMEQGVEALVAAARRAAEEAQTLDAAFHERLRRNAADPIAPPAPAPARPAAAQGGYNGTGVAVGSSGQAAYGHVFGSAPPAAQPPAPSPPAAAQPIVVPPPVPAPETPALRPRLRLTPTREDEAMRALFEPVAENAAQAASGPVDRPPPIALPLAGGGGDEGWSWKDLLTTLDDGGDRMDEEALAGRLAGEIEALGVDAEALLPTPRTDEIARAFGRGEAAAARESVRRLAPAAIRRLARRVETDRVLRDQADQYRSAFGERLLEATRRDGGDGAASLLSSEPGRAWLLFEAAAPERPRARP